MARRILQLSVQDQLDTRIYSATHLVTCSRGPCRADGCSRHAAAFPRTCPRRASTRCGPARSCPCSIWCPRSPGRTRTTPESTIQPMQRLRKRYVLNPICNIHQLAIIISMISFKTPRAKLSYGNRMISLKKMRDVAPGFGRSRSSNPLST